MRSSALLFLCQIVFCLAVQAQEIGIGQWRTHLAYSSSVSSTSDGSELYFATTGSLFAYNTEDQSLQTFSKTEGLNSFGIKIIRKIPNRDEILVAYSNGNIDFFSHENVINLSDIFQKNMTGSKSINEVTFRGDTAYLACDFGIVVLNIEAREIISTYVIGDDGATASISGIEFYGDSIYAFTNFGLKSASMLGDNLADFNFWRNIKIRSNHIASSYQAIEKWQEGLYVSANDSIFSLGEQGLWSFVSALPTGVHMESMRAVNGHLYSIESLDASYSNNSVQVTVLSEQLERSSIEVSGTAILEEVIADAAGNIYVADSYNGTYLLTESGKTKITPNGPSANDVYDIYSDGNGVMIAPGGVTSSWGFKFFSKQMYSFSGGNWWSVWSPSLSSVKDVLQIIKDPANGTLYMASYGGGLVEMNGGHVGRLYKDTVWTWNGSSYDYESVTTMEDVDGHVGSFRITGLAFDTDNNLWMTSYGSPKPLNVKMADGNWYSYRPLVSFTDNATSVLKIDGAGQKWFASAKGDGIVVVNDGGTPETTSDDRWKKLSTLSGAGSLPSNSVYDMAIDDDGELWVGTLEGLAVFYCPEFLFSSGCEASQITIEKDGFIGYAFDEQKINSIEVDGANRKWIGTDNGAYLMSEDGTEELLHFTAENSPLLSDVIIDIGINHSTGEVYFGTELGIVSYKSTATKTDNVTELVVYPNPVEPGYNGTIAIRGLPDNSDVKITDIQGNIVYHDVALGGQAIWDGNSLLGERVQTGVYLVWAATSNGASKAVTKIIFLK